MKPKNVPIEMTENIWEGIYDSFADVPATGAGFLGEKWAANSRLKILDLLDRAKIDAFIPSVTAYNASLLPLVVAMASAETGHARVLDFGGGLGFSYVPVISSMAEGQAVDFHIVEVEQICRMGSQIFADHRRIQFHSSLPKDIGAVSVVHLSTSLQYIEDWRDLLGELAKYSPQYFLLDNLQAGDIRTYASAQNYYGSRIPCWFFNVREVVDAMSGRGFDLLFRSTYEATILGQPQELPQPNFPEEYRLGHACSLLFRRKKSS
jgi:putative methyltransferase (TIGR04325 family)